MCSPSAPKGCRSSTPSKPSSQAAIRRDEPESGLRDVDRLEWRARRSEPEARYGVAELDHHSIEAVVIAHPHVHQQTEAGADALDPARRRSRATNRRTG